LRLCFVTLYTTVLALEFSPLLFERFGWEVPLKLIRMIYVPLVIAGVLLSTLHQSSLGTLYVIAPDKQYGLWYTPLLPVFFFLTAVAGGLAMTIFESFMTFRAFGKRIEAHLLRGMGRIIVVILAAYGVWKFLDLLARGNLGLLTRLTPESVLFVGEMGLGVLLPMALFASRRVRYSESGMFFAALLTIMGFVVNRLNVAITGMAASSGVLYIPSWMEVSVTAAVVAAGFVLFGLAVKHLPVFPRDELPALVTTKDAPRTWQARPALSFGLLLLLWGLLLVGFVAVIGTMDEAQGTEKLAPGDATEPALGRHGEPEALALAGDASGPVVTRPAELILPGPYVFPAGEDSPGEVVFHHESHVDQARPDCKACHMSLFNINVPGEPVTGEITYERIHEGDLCASCHDGNSAFAVDEGCEVCHSQ